MFINDIIDKINYTPFYGTIFQKSKNFDYKNYFNKENIFHYRLYKLIFYLGEKDNKTAIIGLQQIFKNNYGKEIESEKMVLNEDNIVDIKKFEISSNDYLCNCFIKTGDDRITQIKIRTIKGNELIIGSEEGENIIIDNLNDKNDNMILFFFGNYNNYLEAFGIYYIPIKNYLEPFLGFFELRKKYKNKIFKKNIEDKIENFKIEDKVLWKVCSLPENCFNCIIKFCIF